jgi:hypothetical protein
VDGISVPKRYLLKYCQKIRPMPFFYGELQWQGPLKLDNGKIRKLCETLPPTMKNVDVKNLNPLLCIWMSRSHTCEATHTTRVLPSQSLQGACPIRRGDKSRHSTLLEPW